MRDETIALLLAGLLAASTAATADEPATGSTSRETILFVRHGEKPEQGLGQLSCKGLNRALALGGVIEKRYGRVDAVFAPDPSKQKPDGDTSYDYVRPLATVEPTAIRFGLPIQAGLGYDEIGKLREALLAPGYRNATVLVGWEHHKLNEMVPALILALGGDAKPSKWEGDDFDSIWRVTVEWANGKVHASFEAGKEGLDDQPDTCPH
jgi:hypothetical protein